MVNKEKWFLLVLAAKLAYPLPVVHSTTVGAYLTGSNSDNSVISFMKRLGDHRQL